MKRWILWVATAALLLTPRAARAQETAPGLSEDALGELAADAVRTITTSLPVDRQRDITGVYVAIDPALTDVLSLPACDDDGDYVVVVSRALLELVQNVAYASASDRLRGTHILEGYGDLLAREQRSNAHPLPPPAPRGASVAGPPLDAVAHALEQSLLTWIVAGELAHTLNGDVRCPHPTATHERADDVWTEREHDEALRKAPTRMTHLAECDTWATSRLLELGQHDAPVRALLAILVPFEGSRVQGDAWTYVTLHPRARARSERFDLDVQAWRDAERARTETSAVRAPIR